jgi:hypothetical protein
MDLAQGSFKNTPAAVRPSNPALIATAALII